jgi:hypothetical protein
MNIKRCGPAEILRVMSFIDCHWARGHILATCKELMDWQHKAADGCYDYLVASDETKIWGVLGYISTRRFDPHLDGQNVVWLALWKVADHAPAGLGLRMLDALRKLEPHVAIGVNGINFNHPPMYKALRYSVGELRHYFVSNPRSSISLASAPAGYSWPTPSQVGQKWQELTADELRSMNSSTIAGEVLATKTPAYFANRFFDHPIYKYRVFRLIDTEGESALIATRLVEHQGSRVLRLVDFAGNQSVFRSAGAGLKLVMEDSHAEYADLWVHGMDEATILSTGMVPVDPTGPVIVPNYFEPFLARNGRILYAIKQESGLSRPVMIFRADGDQDRPNKITSIH